MEDLRQHLGLKENNSEKLIYGLFPLPNYCIFSEMLKYLLENDMCVLEKIYEVAQAPLGYVFRDFITNMTAKRQADFNLIREGQAENDVTKVQTGNFERIRQVK